MSELHAATALASFEDLEERIGLRNQLAERYRKVPGRRARDRLPGRGRGRPQHLQGLHHPDRPRVFGMDAAAVAAALAAEGIQTRRYYSPPVHRQRAYRWVGPANGGLPETDRGRRPGADPARCGPHGRRAGRPGRGGLARLGGRPALG
jgi:dTDP-4-amino-4,6-dideoxygalactose transaminase